MNESSAVKVVMNEEAYTQTATQIGLCGRIVLDMPLEEFVEAVGRNQALAPLLAPSEWMRGGSNNLDEQEQLGKALLEFKRVCVRLREKAIERLKERTR